MQEIRNLEHDSLIAIEWFEANYMKLNTEKCHVLIAGKGDEPVWTNVGNSEICESTCVKLLGVDIDSELKFSKHISNLCIKANRKLTAISRYASFLTHDQLRTTIKGFVESQFSYCNLAWMFHSRKLNHKINKVQERGLRLLYGDYKTTFEQLLLRDGSFTVHQRNIQSLMIEMYKVKHELDPSLLEDIFQRKKHIGSKLRKTRDFVHPLVNTVHYGEDSLANLGCHLWDLLPDSYKNTASLLDFKKV